MKPGPILAALLMLLWHNAPALELPLGGARFEVPASSLRQLRFGATLRQQVDFSCGSAALATLLTYHYGHPVSEQRVFEQMYLHGDQAKIRREGFSMLDMQRFLAANGLRADGFELPLQKLVDAGLPAIVLVSERGYHHFVVIKGFAQERILVGDPSSGARAMPRADFEAIWVSRLLFVLHGYPGKASFNAAADWRAAPAAPLATLLTHHYGFPVSEQRVFEQMYLNGDQARIRKEGFSMLDMKNFLAASGFRADGFQLPLYKLAAAGLPAIVLVSDRGYHHFVVVKGVSDGRVLVGDPSSGTRALSVARFQQLWSNRLLFVIHDYAGAVGFNLDADWRVAPRAPLAAGIPRDGLDLLTLPKHGPGDF